MLERLCLTWHGWVSAAVYLHAHPREASSQLHAAVWRLDQLHLELEQTGTQKHDNACDSAQLIIMPSVMTTGYVFSYWVALNSLDTVYKAHMQSQRSSSQSNGILLGHQPWQHIHGSCI